MDPNLSIKTCVGEEIIPFIPQLAELRIEIFRDFPYLYDGTLAYENEYLKMSYLVTCIKSVVLIMVLNALCNASKSWTLLNALME